MNSIVTAAYYTTVESLDSEVNYPKKMFFLI